MRQKVRDYLLSAVTRLIAAEIDHSQLRRDMIASAAAEEMDDIAQNGLTDADRAAIDEVLAAPPADQA